MAKEDLSRLFFSFFFFFFFFFGGGDSVFGAAAPRCPPGGSPVTLKHLEHTGSLFELICREASALKSPRRCCGLKIFYLI